MTANTAERAPFTFGAQANCTDGGYGHLTKLIVDPVARWPIDFGLNEDLGVAFVTTHRQNTVERVPLQPSDDARKIVIGELFSDQLVGPSSAAGAVGHDLRACQQSLPTVR